MEIQIIKCGEAHLPVLTEFYTNVTKYLEKTINYPKWTVGIYPGKDSIKQDIFDGGQYMCLIGDKVVGAFVLNDDPRGDYSKGEWKQDLEPGEYLVIHTLAVSPEFYGKGIGREMVEYCIMKAKVEGYEAIRVDVVPDNFPARKLYEKSGFKFAGEKDLLRNIEAIPEFALYEINFMAE